MNGSPTKSTNLSPPAESSETSMVGEEVLVLLEDVEHRLGPGDGGHHFQPLWLELDRTDVAHWRWQR